MGTTYAPGIRPINRVDEAFINCPNRKFQCAWGFSHSHPYLTGYANGAGHWWLKFINMSCRLHSKIPHSAIPETVRYGPAVRVKKDGRRSYH
jgi:hypothetical protein